MFTQWKELTYSLTYTYVFCMHITDAEVKSLRDGTGVTEIRQELESEKTKTKALQEHLEYAQKSQIRYFLFICSFRRNFTHCIFLEYDCVFLKELLERFYVICRGIYTRDISDWVDVAHEATEEVPAHIRG